MHSLLDMCLQHLHIGFEHGAEYVTNEGVHAIRMRLDEGIGLADPGSLALTSFFAMFLSLE